MATNSQDMAVASSMCISTGGCIGLDQINLGVKIVADFASRGTVGLDFD